MDSNQDEPMCNKVLRDINFIKERLGDLTRLSNAAFTMGFENLCSSIDCSVDSIYKKLSSIEKYTKEDFNDRFIAAQQASTNVLKAALAGLELNNNE